MSFDRIGGLNRKGFSHFSEVKECKDTVKVEATSPSGGPGIWMCMNSGEPGHLGLNGGQERWAILGTHTKSVSTL